MLSIIIPAYNEETLIAATLRAAHDAAAAASVPYEIIVVNDASTDRTAEIAEQCCARVVEVHKRQIAAVRNEGARVAKGDVFIFIDADTIVPSTILSSVMKAVGEGAVGGGSFVRMGRPMPLHGWFYFELFWLLWRPLRLAAGCFIFAKRQAFEAVGGFDEQYFASEEIWLSRALKGQGKFVILRDCVTTSARKARLYGPLQLFGIALRLLIKGPKSWQRREGLELWYDGQREK